jgi:predicted aconitase
MNRSPSIRKTSLYKKAVEMLEALGTIYRARGRVSISHVHLVSTFASKMGEGGIRVIERMVDEGNLLQVPSTMDPCDIEPQYWSRLHLSKDMISRQKRLDKALLSLGLPGSYG